MYHLMESIFNIGYLAIVIALGVRLTLEKDKNAKLYGAMAIILGLGDAFHLIPRVVSHLSVDGFNKYASALSWGQFVTGITMTIFYLLFYVYYCNITKESNKTRHIIVVLLVLARIATILCPKNMWGGEGNYIFGLIRNIPFLILGILLIIWTYAHKDTDGLKHTSLLIFLSFLFYVPVVVGVKYISLLGVLMMPKTVAYVLLVVVGYRHFIPKFSRIGVLKMAITMLIMGLIGAVFYREFSKYYGFTGYTPLNVVHTHLIAMGAMFLLLIYNMYTASCKNAVYMYISGLGLTVVTFIVRGIYTIVSNGSVIFPDAALSGIAGIGHFLFGVGLVLVLIKIFHQEEKMLA